MTETLVVLGAVCAVAAVVGGGVTVAGSSLPVVNSVPRQLLLFGVGMALVVGGLNIDGGNGNGSNGPPTTGRTADTGDIGLPDPTLTLSRTSGPPGTIVRISGTGFQPDERVEIRFDTQILGSVRADERGDFDDFQTTIPSTPFRNSQHMIFATGRQSIATAQHPFQVT